MLPELSTSRPLTVLFVRLKQTSPSVSNANKLLVGGFVILTPFSQVSNGLAWSADGQTLYYIDSPTRQVLRYVFNLGDGSLMGKKVIYTVADVDGYPDGMSIGASEKCVSLTS